MVIKATIAIRKKLTIVAFDGRAEELTANVAFPVFSKFSIPVGIPKNKDAEIVAMSRTITKLEVGRSI